MHDLRSERGKRIMREETMKYNGSKEKTGKYDCEMRNQITKIGSGTWKTSWGITFGTERNETKLRK